MAFKVSQEVEHFCRQYGIKISPVGKDKVVVLSKAEWTDAFDDWSDAYIFLNLCQNKFKNGGEIPVWSKSS